MKNKIGKAIQSTLIDDARANVFPSLRHFGGRIQLR